MTAASASSEAPNTAPAVQGEDLNLEIKVATEGILYAYVSNESNWDAPVMFDNFSVQQTTLTPEVVDIQTPNDETIYLSE